MSEQRLAKVEALFQSVVDLPVEDRERVLAERCDGNERLRAYVERLLANHDSGMGEFLKSPIDPALVASVSTSSVAKPAAQPPIFALGEQVARRYRVNRLLGQGGMGEVYEALDEELGVTLALKTLRLDLAREPGALRRLKQEVLLARSITHANVCRVYDLGRHETGDGQPVWFLTMELLPGETLAERLGQRGPLRVAEAQPIVEQMVAGLGAAHRAGVLHLDFKSGNVMLVRGRNDDERAVVTDFGLARMAGATLEVGTQPRIAGTPAYMAPEQVRGRETAAAADIYALGVVLYEMVTGTVPFTGRTLWEAAVRRLDAAPPSPRSVVPDLDEHWEAVILRCLSHEPRDRFVQAEQVAAGLRGREPAVFLEVTTDAATAKTAPMATGVRGRHTLPAERDAFVGREAELEELGRRLASGSKLVTLFGPAGMGKTRLAVRFGSLTLGDWPGGVWFCDLTEARSSNGIISAVGRSLEVPLGRGNPVEQLGHAIAGRGRCLVILDNFEQVVGHAGATLGRWLERAEDARFVVTSRERLRMRGEDVQMLEPLDLESGVELFLERARRQRPGYDASGFELESVREVVRLTEGMPLAIELAAARVRVMTAGQVVDRMRERLRVLAGEGEDRHGSLRAAIDASWDLLTPWEQSAWAQCAVFEGGFTLEAAENVVDLSAWPDAPWVVDVVQSLTDKSLVRVSVAEGLAGGSIREPRFGMYASLQEYARMKLQQAGELATAECRVEAERSAEERHGEWFAQYGTEEAIEALDGPGGVERRSKLERELENLVTACRRALRRGNGERAAVTYLASWAVFELRGPVVAGVELGREVLADSRFGDQARANVLRTLGQAERLSGEMGESRSHLETALAIARKVGDRRLEGIVCSNLGGFHRSQGRMEDARIQLEAALAIAREVGDRRLEGTALGNLSGFHLGQDRMEARVHLEAALAIAREVGDRRFEALTSINLGALHLDLGLIEEARGYLEAALAIARAVGDRRAEAIAVGNLGNLHSDQGRIEEALAHYEAALAINRLVGERTEEANVLVNLGELHAEQGRLEAARGHFERALAIHRLVGERRVEAIDLGNLGNLLRDQGRMEEARPCYEEALDISRQVGDRIGEGTHLGGLGSLLLNLGKITEAKSALNAAESILRQVGAPLPLGMLLCTLARLEHGCGNIAAARAAIAESEAICAQIGSGPNSELGRQLGKLRQELQAGL